ncbi:MAG: hypothetical protein QXH55_04915 [Candidatus Korarchaeota archaeon]
MDAKEYEEKLRLLEMIVDKIGRGSAPEKAIVEVLGFNETLLYVNKNAFWNKFLGEYKDSLILQATALLIKNYSLDPKRIFNLIEKMLILAKHEKLWVIKRQDIYNKLRRQMKLLSAVSTYSTGLLIGLANLGYKLQVFTGFQAGLFQMSLAFIFVFSSILAGIKVSIHLLLSNPTLAKDFHSLMKEVLVVLIVFMILGLTLSVLLVH